MQAKRGLAQIELMVVVCVLLVLISMLPLVLRNMKKRAVRILCGTNLKGLGVACVIYANDYDDFFPRIPGEGPWSKTLGFDYDLERPDFKGAQSATGRTITASWYLLVREVDVSPRSFVCPEDRSDHSGYVTPRKYTAFDGMNPRGLDLVQLWDFGSDPYSHVGYAYHNPYGKFPADGTFSAGFAIAADMSPWFSKGDIVGAESGTNAPQIITWSDPGTWKYGLTLNHEIEKEKHSFGQNVLYADGHVSYENRPNTGANSDNIFTFWSVEENPTEQERQGGTAPTGRGPENDAKSKEDSFLAI